MTSPTDAPRPALGELARRATELIAARKAFDAARYPADFNSREGEVYEAARLAYRDALREWEAAVSDSSNGPERVLQLVALATGGAAGGQQAPLCVHCGQPEEAGHLRYAIRDEGKRGCVGESHATTGFTPARCICSSGFGMNLSCPVHAPERPADA